MKNVNWIFLLLSIFMANFAHADGTSYRTSTGAIFSKIDTANLASPWGDRSGWRDPSGKIWSAYQGDYPNRNAAAVACHKIGASLPAAADYARLASYFDRKTGDEDMPLFSDQGRADLFAIFLDMRSRWFWTSTAHSGDPLGTYIFTANNGNIFSDSDSDEELLGTAIGAHCIR